MRGSSDTGNLVPQKKSVTQFSFHRQNMLLAWKFTTSWQNKSAACQKTMQSLKIVQWTSVLMITPVGPAQRGQMNATREEELLGKLVSS